MKLIAKLLITALGLLVISRIIMGVSIDGFWIALVVAIILGLMNLIIKPILTILTLPITLLTFGLFSFIINAFLFWLASTFISGFDVDGFLPALVGSLVLAVIQLLGAKALKVID